MESVDAALERLCDPSAAVSSHYVIDDFGKVYRLVAEERRAWHAGVGFWRGERDINSASIGIELANPGHSFGYRPFPKAQMEALAQLSSGIIARHGMAADNVLAHSDIAPLRKKDPGELFDWRWLAAQGVGVWPEDGGDAAAGDVAEAQALLARYGYDCPQTGELDEATRAAILAFQRHFHADNLSANPDPMTIARLRNLVRQTGR